MAKAARKSITTRKRRRRSAARKFNTARKRKRKRRSAPKSKSKSKSKPERSLLKRLKDYPPLPPLSPEEVAELHKAEAELHKTEAQQRKFARLIDRHNAIRDGLIPPPWVEQLIEAKREQREESRPQPQSDDLDMPGEKPAERRARQFLYRLMKKRPTGLPGKTKRDFARVCRKRFRISRRSFDRIWDWTINQTDAIAFRASGPRGSHGSPRR